ncbi:hypothetical protein RJ640_024269 [Escallonia rubra]|uniref:HMA domain-containing protein n=1 Tax=Escallonia rubra TaxID=112253 RepID=A0AA88RFX3_9ASTE|nr:hypothetical protein RJ640_024269 [Escallonia rubra]
MGKLSFGRVLDSLCLSPGSSSCLCVSNNYETSDEYLERKPLVASEDDQVPQTLAFLIKPKVVVLKVSMHCNGCARKVEKHIAKMEGVTSYQVDMETKMVVVIGDIVPFEVLESVSRVKNAELWAAPS